MAILRRLESDFSYFRKLGEAGWGGIASTRPQTDRYKIPSWKATAIGAGLGMLSSRLIAKRKTASGVAMGGLLGSVAGFGAGFAWTSRGLMQTAARNARRRIDAVRDARWLEQNPIDYA